MKKALYPGTFDPITNGHIDIIERASKIVDHLIVGVVEKSTKTTLFNVDERINFVLKTTKKIKNISVIRYSGLTVNTAIKNDAKIIIRGLRITSDYEYESEMALVNMTLSKNIETLCLFSSLNYQILSSSRVKEIGALGGDISKMIPKIIIKPLLEKIN
ncbi:MAG: pantetheine-phosphate adenylyltransferase [Chloroflexi bacterium]|nr:pantetheine-phosphate adenylyltransferase [Chloroflexota bacterium]